MAVTPPNIVKRLVKQQPLVAQEMDDNLQDILDYTTAVETTFANGTGFVDNTVDVIKLVHPNTAGQFLIDQTSGTPLWAAMSGDATLAADGALTLANTAVTANTYGAATTVPVITVDTKGRVTGVVDTPMGGIIQVLSTGTTGGATAGNTGLTLAITPASTSSKILVLVGQSMETIQQNNSSITAYMHLKVTDAVRTAVTLRTQQSSEGIYFNSMTQRGGGGAGNFCYLDSPAIATAVTYSVELSGSGIVGGGDMTLMEVAI